MKISVFVTLILTAVFGRAETPSYVLQGTNSLQITSAFINELAAEALTNHPAILAADARVASAQANEKSIRRWEDPNVRFGFLAADKVRRMDDGDAIVSVDQKLPAFGKPKAARDVAAIETKVEVANADLQFQEVRREIAIAVFKTALAERVVEIGQQDLPWLETTLALLQSKHEVRGATQVEILRVQNERAKRIDQIKTDLQLVEHERLNLNRLLNRDLRSPWPSLRLPEVAKPIVFDEMLLKLALRSEPKLKMMRQQIAQAESKAEMVRRQRYPDLMVGAELRTYSEAAEFREGLVTFGFNIPWGNRKKYEADFKREQLLKKAAELDADDYELSVRNEIHDLTVKIDAFRREAILYRDDIIPRSQTALESSRAAWESSSGMFKDVLEARRMLLDAQLEYARAVSEQFQMMSMLVLCCGLGDLEALEVLSSRQENVAPKQLP